MMTAPATGIGRMRKSTASTRCCTHRSEGELGAIAKRHPGLKLIIDHMGILARSADALGLLDETADLHVHPNIYVKVSSLPSYSTHPYPYANITKYVINLINKMGPERCFWGTDLTRLTETKGLNYTQAIEHFTKHMGLTESQLEQIMGAGICKCLDWPPEAAKGNAPRRPAKPQRRAGDAHSSENRLDGGEALLEAFRSLGIDFSSLARVGMGSAVGGGGAPEDERRPVLATSTSGTRRWPSISPSATPFMGRMQAVLLHAGAGLLQGTAASTVRCWRKCRFSSARRGHHLWRATRVDPGSQWYEICRSSAGPTGWSAGSSVGQPGRQRRRCTKWSSERRARATNPARPGLPEHSGRGAARLLVHPRSTMPVAAPATDQPPDEIEQLAALIGAAETPIILTESAGRSADAFHALVAFARHSVSLSSKRAGHDDGNFPKTHPLYLGSRLEPFMSTTDLVLLVACRRPGIRHRASGAARTVVIDETPQRPHMVHQVLFADLYLEAISPRRCWRPASARRRRSTRLCAGGVSIATPSRIASCAPISKPSRPKPMAATPSPQPRWSRRCVTSFSNKPSTSTRRSPMLAWCSSISIGRSRSAISMSKAGWAKASAWQSGSRWRPPKGLSSFSWETGPSCTTRSCRLSARRGTTTLLS